LALGRASDLEAFKIVQAFAENGPIARGDVPALIGLLADSSADVRERACLALGGIGIAARTAVPALDEIARDSTNPSSLAAITALGQIADAAAVPTLTALLSSPRESVSEFVLVALAHIGIPARSAGPAIRAKLKAGSIGERELAAAALGVLYAQTIVNAARQQRTSGDSIMGQAMFGTFNQPRTRRAVLEEISAFGVVDPLTLALRDSMPSVRSAAAAALDKILGWPIEIRSDLGSRKRMIAYVDTGAFSFRGDGLGFYDGLEIGGFCLHPLECSNNFLGPSNHPKARAVELDLSHPVASSGATRLGVIRDYDAFFAPNWDQDSTRKVPCRGTVCAFPRAIILMPVDSTVVSQRVEIRFYVNGKKRLLQFGPWVSGQWSGIARLNGNGTTNARITRTSWWTWTVELPPGSRGRLWDISNPQTSRDLGLYEFSFRVFFEPRDMHDTMPISW
jgi:hypothetical protein